MKFIDFFTFISKKILNFASIKRYVILLFITRSKLHPIYRSFRNKQQKRYEDK